jgi:hypothetical protein
MGERERRAVHEPKRRDGLACPLARGRSEPIQGPRAQGGRKSPSTPMSAAASERASWDSWRRAARRSTPSPPSGWRCTAGPNLATSTLKTYAVVWDRHISPRLGSYELRHLSAEACQRFAAELAADGVDPGARRKALALLGGVLQRGVEWGRLPGNPVRVVRKPSGSRARASVPSRRRRSRRCVATCWVAAGWVTRR